MPMHSGLSLEAANGADVWSLLQVEGDRQEVMADCDASIFCKSDFTVTVAAATAGAGADADGGARGAGRRLRLHFA